MSLEQTHKKIKDYFVEKLERFGSVPQGVDYNGPQAQTVRFEQLVKVIDTSHPFSVIDYGSGYGGLCAFLQAKGWQFEYYGIDQVEKMILAGRANFKDFPRAHFTTDENEVPVADYLLAGAIFNLKMDTPAAEWQAYVLETLDRMNALCLKGFAFNMLTRYSDPERMAQRPDLFYADPLVFFDHCKRHFSRNVALLHDYDLYDFTILVRKNT